MTDSVTWTSFVKGYANLKNIPYWQAVGEAGVPWRQFKDQMASEEYQKNARAAMPEDPTEYQLKKKKKKPTFVGPEEKEKEKKKLKKIKHAQEKHVQEKSESKKRKLPPPREMPEIANRAKKTKQHLSPEERRYADKVAAKNAKKIARFLLSKEDHEEEQPSSGEEESERRESSAEEEISDEDEEMSDDSGSD